VRVECRIGGSDLNPYLAMAAQLAAGIAGIEEQLELSEPMSGDVYQGQSNSIPQTLRDARVSLNESSMLREALGDDVVDHYARAAEWEIEDFDRVVTDYEARFRTRLIQHNSLFEILREHNIKLYFADRRFRFRRTRGLVIRFCPSGCSKST